MAKAENKKLPKLGVIVIGHVDSGKSTTTGRLVYDGGAIDKRVVEKFEKESKDMGKGSFMFAWILDKLKAERERGITIDISFQRFFTKKYDVTIIDAPGHRDFIKNMITGASQADAAILVVSCATGEFEAGISADGQTREHALLAYTLGINNIIVIVNKIDSEVKGVKYSEERFKEVKSEIINMLGKIGYKKDRIPVIPASGWLGINLVTKESKEGGIKVPWYDGFSIKVTDHKSKETVIAKGFTLIEAIDSIAEPVRLREKPLRCPIQDVYKISGHGTVPSGRIETGVMKKGMTVYIAPKNVLGEIKTIETHHTPLEEAGPGENVGFCVKNLDHKSVKRGWVVSDPKNRAKSVKEFTAKIVVIYKDLNKISVGYTPVLDVHTAHVACRFKQLINLIDREKGTIAKENPDHIGPMSTATVLLVPTKELVVERFQDFPSLGRFAIRDMGRTVAVGLVTDIKADVGPSESDK